MKLEDQVCNLELAKRLKELGVKQESLFYWKHNTDSPNGKIDEWHLVHYGEPYNVDSPYHVSAFTVAELGEMIKINKSLRLPEFGANSCKWFWEVRLENKLYEFETEADARGKMLIYLIENNLLPPQG